MNQGRAKYVWDYDLNIIQSYLAESQPMPLDRSFYFIGVVDQRCHWRGTKQIFRDSPNRFGA